MYIGKILEVGGIMMRVTQLRDLSGRMILPDEVLQPYTTYDFSMEPVPAEDNQKLESP